MQSEGVRKMRKDELNVMLDKDEIRFLVEAYYDMQENRIRAQGQKRALERSEKPSSAIEWLLAQNQLMEDQIKNALDNYTKEAAVGQWARSHYGVGPVIAAGFLAHIDIAKAPTAGHIYSFAGLVPGVKWEKGQKRPWNAALKVLCWKLGESFVKVSNKEGAIYGQLYRERKDLETQRNEEFFFNDEAARILASKKIGKDTDAYKAYSVGKLPPAHIHARAKRHAVKMFISHLHHKMYEDHFGVAPALPYAIAQLDHAHMFMPETGPKRI